MSILEKIAHTLATNAENMLQAATMAILGVVVSLGRDLQQAEPDPMRIIVGRAITTAALSLAAGTLLAIIPEMPFLGLLGLAAGLASLGSAFLERALLTWLRR